MDKRFKFSPEAVIKQANKNKEKIMKSSIEDHPIDHLDSLVNKIDYENKNQVINQIKVIIQQHPDLSAYLLEEIDTHKKIVGSKVKQYEEIQKNNKESQKDESQSAEPSYDLSHNENLKELIRLRGKLMALTALVKTMMGEDNED